MRINLKKGVVVYGPTNSPENTVFVHGRTNKPIVNLPEEWGEIVNWKNISVQVICKKMFKKGCFFTPFFI